jgi:hypothetical protein
MVVSSDGDSTPHRESDRESDFFEHFPARSRHNGGSTNVSTLIFN